MYSIKQASRDIVMKDKKSIAAGIHENVMLTDITVKTAPFNNSLYIGFTFDVNGVKIDYNEFEITKKDGEDDATFAERQKKQVIKFLQILKCFYTEDELSYDGDFKGMINWMQEMLNKAKDSQKLRLKLLYNKRGFLEVPRQAVFTFIEPMSITQEDSKIAIMSFDKEWLVRPEIIADTEPKTEANPFTLGGATVVTPTVDGLPF